MSIEGAPKGTNPLIALIRRWMREYKQKPIPNLSLLIRDRMLFGLT
jgi:hypothetical protein